jgi:hypothetical protein
MEISNVKVYSTSRVFFKVLARLHIISPAALDDALETLCYRYC